MSYEYLYSRVKESHRYYRSIKKIFLSYTIVDSLLLDYNSVSFLIVESCEGKVSLSQGTLFDMFVSTNKSF